MKIQIIKEKDYIDLQHSINNFFRMGFIKKNDLININYKIDKDNNFIAFIIYE